MKFKAVLSLLLLAGSKGFAWQPDPDYLRRGETVLQAHLRRALPSYLGPGLHFGGFMLYPKLQLSESYDTNIFATEEREKNSFITTVNPELRLQSLWSRHDLHLTAGANIGRYHDPTFGPVLDFEDYYFGGGGRLDITRALGFSLDINYQRLHERPGTPDTVVGKRVTEYHTVQTEGRLRFKPARFGIELFGSHNYLDYSDTPTSGPFSINNDDRDRHLFEGGMRLSYDLFPGYAAFIEGSYNVRRYDRRPDDFGFDRNSSGWRVRSGIRLDLTALITGELYAGYLSQDYEDRQFNTIRGVDGGLRLIWTPTQLTAVIPYVERTARETIFPGTPGSLTLRAGVDLQHELRRNLLLTGGFSYLNQDYEGIGRNDNYFAANFGIDYRFNPRLFGRLGYSLLRRESSFPREDFTRHAGTLQLGLSF